MAVQSVEPDVDGRSVGGARRGWSFNRWSPTWTAVQSVEPVDRGGGGRGFGGVGGLEGGPKQAYL